MKKGILISIVALLVFIATPVMAIGPQKAEKNPHIMITPEGAEILLPSGVLLEWVADTEIGVTDIVLIKNAAKFKIRKAPDITLLDLQTLFTDPIAALEYENKWGYASYEVLEDFFEWLISIGFPISPEEVELILPMYPEGMYMKFVNVGK